MNELESIVNVEMKYEHKIDLLLVIWYMMCTYVSDL